ncbi:MAG: DEAD/DEAH box helicase [Gemmatimonadaceae bacterium]|jgi:superfamily II DNA or RNA helicase|nr:DEAD/DEAH box helicase [Gemmatimonadaceae bacterium]
MAATSAHLTQVLATLGAAGLGLRTEAQPNSSDHGIALGDVVLMPHQRSALTRLRHVVPQFGGALLADDVGLGKTFVAIAFARAYADVSVIVPAALQLTWRGAITRAGDAAAHLRVLSLQAFSRRGPDARATSAAARLVIIDEAHHLRNPATLRYAAIAEWCRGAHVLLLSATPVHNRPNDLTHLLALFLGRSAHALTDADRLRLIIRRRHEDTTLTTPAPTIRVLAPHRVADVPAITAAIITLPPPLPTRDGRAAAALVALGILRAWCSSAAACRALLQRRQLRARALAGILDEGRWPTRRELAAWSVGDDAMQLGFTALLVAAPDDAAAHATKSRVPDRLTASASTLHDARRALASHEEALDALVQAVRAVADDIDRQRIEAVRAMRRALPGHTALAFTQFADTVHGLGRLLRWDDGVATLTARGGRVAGGPLTRREVLERVAPHAHGRAAPPPHERIRLLLTTDLLSEGVNLQDASMVIHLDLPWTTAAIRQREGRVARLGSPHREVYVGTIEPPGGAAAVLAIAERLQRKARAADASLQPERRSARAHSSWRATTTTTPTRSLLAMLDAWYDGARHTQHTERAEVERADPAHTHRDARRRDAAPELVPVAELHRVRLLVPRAVRAGWLAALSHDGETRLYGGWCRGPWSRTTASRVPAVLHALVSAATSHQFAADVCSGDSGVRRSVLASVHRAVHRALTQWHVHTLVDAMDAPAIRAQRVLRDLLASASVRERLALLPDVRRATHQMRRLRGAGNEARLDALLRHPGLPDRRAWLDALLALLHDGLPPSAHPPNDDGPPSPDSDVAPPAGLLALLLLWP